MSYDNIVGINTWSKEDLENAIVYYNEQLLKPHDDNEHNWFLRAIDKCNTLLDKINGTSSEWEELFK